MHSKTRLKKVFAVLLCLVAGTSCGKFGKLADPATTLSYNEQTKQCMESVPTDFSAYMQGAITPDKWASTCDCVLRALTEFKTNVVPSGSDGYTASDLHQFVSRFIATSNSPPASLFTSLIELKSYMFGGPKLAISSEDLSALTTFLTAAKKESLSALPFIANPSVPGVDGVRVSVSRLAQTLRPLDSVAFEGLVSVAKSFFDYKSMSFPQDKVGLVSSGKALLIGGSADAVTRSEWPRVLDVAAIGGGLYLAFSAANNVHDQAQAGFFDDPVFRSVLVQIAERIFGYFNDVIQNHGGVVDWALLDNVIDNLPLDDIQTKAPALKLTLHRITQRMFPSQIPNGVDTGTTNKVLSELLNWNLGQTHLDGIYSFGSLSKSGLSLQEFNQAAMGYSQAFSGSDLAAIQKLQWLAANFRPLYSQGDDFQISFNSSMYSFHHFTMLNIFRRLAELFAAGYGDTSGEVSFNGLDAFMADTKDVALAFQVIDPNIPNTTMRHFVNMNLLTWASRGATTINANEITYYVPILVSAMTLANRVKDVLQTLCAEKVRNGKSAPQDVVGWFWMDPHCVRREFLSRRPEYFDHFPLVLKDYESLKPNERGTWLYSLEKAARRYGYSHEPFGAYDTNAVTLMVHLVESMFSRFDVNQTERLELSEAMLAYPVFKNQLATVGKLDINNEPLLQAVLTYAIKFGAPPDQTNVVSLVEFVGWMADRPFWTISTSRYGIIRTLSSMVTPEALPGTQPGSDGQSGLPVVTGKAGQGLWTPDFKFQD